MIYAQFGLIGSKTDVKEIERHFPSIEHHLTIYQKYMNKQFEEFYHKSTKKIDNDFQKHQLEYILRDIFLYKNGLINRLE